MTLTLAACNARSVTGVVRDSTTARQANGTLAPPGVVEEENAVQM
jgi:hypothetical protein